MKKEWLIDHNPILGTLSIKEIDYPHTPIAQVATPQGNWMENPEWKKKALSKARMLSSAPLMYNALLKVKEVMDLEAGKPDMDQLYDMVKDAIKAATYENRESKL